MTRIPYVRREEPGPEGGATSFGLPPWPASRGCDQAHSELLQAFAATVNRNLETSPSSGEDIGDRPPR